MTNISGLPVILQDTRTQDGVSATTTYLYGLDLVAETDGAGVTSYYLGDGLGSTVQLVSASGAVTDSYSYDVFGAPRTTAGATANDFRFTGEQADRNANRGLYYLRARHYDPALGRFLGQDPLPSGNVYAYAKNNPASYVDLDGQFPRLPRLVRQYATTCSGKYRNLGSSTYPLGNFGDLKCDFSEAALQLELEGVDPGNAESWLRIARCESFYDSIPLNPNARNPDAPDPAGAWGLFQMGRGLNGQFDHGDVSWRRQVANAVAYSRILEKSGSPRFSYWACASTLGID